MTELPSSDDWHEGNEEDLTTIEGCYCPNCGGGRARTLMLPTKVPCFREIIIMALNCEDCAFRNSEVNFGGEIQPKGERMTLVVNSTDDLNRQLIKSDSASLFVPKLDFEIPRTTQRGSVSTIEGVLKTAAESLETLQPERLRLGDIDNFHRCRKVINQLKRYAGDEALDDDDDDEEEKASIFPYEIILDDPAGNSFIENPFAPSPDPNMKSDKYWRNPSQDMSLGLQPSQKAVEEGSIDNANPLHKNVANASAGSHRIEKLSSTRDGTSIGREEVMKFPTTCSHCYKPAETDMCITDIPHFKEVIIMSMVCDNCGYKSNEIKGGGAIPKYGNRITVTVRSTEELGREVLKSDTAGLAIPEIELELDEGGLDGVYTTIEGLLDKLRDRLTKANPFGSGDSARKQHRENDGGDFSRLSPNTERYLAFLQKLKDMQDGLLLPFTLIISDPLSNSFVGPIPGDAVALSLQAEKEGNSRCYEEYVDTGMTVEEYERTHEQNEILGLNDMKTEKYGAEVDYGTDQLEEDPDRIRRLDVRGPDHPHEVGMAPVEGDTTVMGAKSKNFAVPSMGQRGKRVEPATTSQPVTPVSGFTDVLKIIHDAEYQDKDFIMNEEYVGPKEGMAFKDGGQGLGYYKDIPLHTLWELNQTSD